jgi:hypothetical protein
MLTDMQMQQDELKRALGLQQEELQTLRAELARPVSASIRAYQGDDTQAGQAQLADLAGEIAAVRAELRQMQRESESTLDPEGSVYWSMNAVGANFSSLWPIFRGSQVVQRSGQSTWAVGLRWNNLCSAAT